MEFHLFKTNTSLLTPLPLYINILKNGDFINKNEKVKQDLKIFAFFVSFQYTYQKGNKFKVIQQKTIKLHNFRVFKIFQYWKLS